MKPSPQESPRDQRGIALVIALLVLLTLSALATASLVAVNVDTKISETSLRESKALNLAEAGLNEAIARIRSGEVPDSLNPRMVTQIFLAEPGFVPVMGADTIALATAQTPPEWLRYSEPQRSPGVLTISYKTDAAHTQVYRYDPSISPSIQTYTGTPIFVVTSTGRSGKDVRTVVAEIVNRPIVPNLKSTVSTRSGDVNLWCGAAGHGPFMYNGMNHRPNTPTGTGVTGPDPENYVGYGDLPAFWCPSTITWGNNVAFVCCTPVGAVLQNQPTSEFYAGPWQALSLTQADFYALIGKPSKTVPAKMSGITYLDNDNISQNGKGAWSVSGVSGDGLLYVDGDLTVNGDFYWKGLVYTEGRLVINGNIWVLGGVVVADPGTFSVKHIQATFLYSSDAISQSVGRGINTFYNLSWHESP